VNGTVINVPVEHVLEGELQSDSDERLSSTGLVSKMSGKRSCNVKNLSKILV
jgi:hypothetical protein